MVLALAMIAGCHRPLEVLPEPSDVPKLERGPGRNMVDTGIDGTTGRAVRYSCEGLGPSATTPSEGHHVTRALLAASPMGTPGPTGSPSQLDAALEAAASVSVEQLTMRDRILIQAAALRVAKDDSQRAKLAASVVRRMALDGWTLENLGSDPRRELEPWLGSSESWRERRGPACGPVGAHDSAYNGELAFRTVRSGKLRAIFAQVVAFDTELRPHVTPVVGLVEMRNGMRADSPACVIEAAAGGLSPAAFDDLHRTPFVDPMPEGQVGCGSCHTGRGPNDLADLGREEGGAFRIDRRITLLARAEGRASELRKLIGLGRPSTL